MCVEDKHDMPAETKTADCRSVWEAALRRILHIRMCMG